MTDHAFHAFQIAYLKEVSRDLREAAKGNRTLSNRMLIVSGWAVEKRYLGRHFDLSPLYVSIWTAPGTGLRSLAPPDPSRNIKDAADGMPKGWRIDVLGMEAAAHPRALSWFCQLRNEDGDHDYATGLGNTEALARCDAVVQAKIAELSA